MRPETPDEQRDRMFRFAFPGAPLPTDLTQDAAVTARDKALAPRFWAKYATPLLKRLLNARKAE